MAGSDLGEGWFQLGLIFTYGQRSDMLTGESEVPNPEDTSSKARIYTFDTNIGIWRSLSHG